MSNSKSAFNLNIGMPEFIFCGGIYLFSVAKFLSLSLIVAGACCSFIRYCMDRNDEETKEKTTKKLIKEMCDSATAISFANMAPQNTKIN